MKNTQTKIIFLNQMAGPLFRELAEDLASVWSPSLLYTGHPHTAHRWDSQFLSIKAAPEYDRSNNFRKLISWIHYLLRAFFIICAHSSKSLLFIVSNPPFLGVLGLIFKLIRKQKYVILVYDIYPDILISLGRLKKGLLFRIWDYLNRAVLQNSNMVITIGKDMAVNLEKKFDVTKTNAKKLIYIPPWTDIDVIRPISKEKNWFAAKYNQIDKITVLYSGNMGYSHDIETILDVAKNLANEPKIHFLFIGEGVKWRLIQDTIRINHLKNITLLPFQPEEVLPYSLSTGDIGIVSFQKGTETYMVPSKAYYYLAAQLVLLIFSEGENELTRMVKERNCGVHVRSGNIEQVIQNIFQISANARVLEQYKKAARKTAEELYSRKNTQVYADAIRTYAWPF